MTKKASQPRKQRIVRQEMRGYQKIRRIVFGLQETPYTSGVAKDLRARGFDVAFVANAEEARKSAVGHTDTAIVVPVAPQAAGGLLTTAKIVTALPTAKVILLAVIEDDRVAQFAEFIDANIAFESDGPASLLAAIVE